MNKSIREWRIVYPNGTPTIARASSIDEVIEMIELAGDVMPGWYHAYDGISFYRMEWEPGE